MPSATPAMPQSTIDAAEVAFVRFIQSKITDAPEHEKEAGPQDQEVAPLDGFWACAWHAR